MHFCLICIYSIKYLISGKCDLDPVAKPQQASNHTIVLVRVKPSKICHIAHVLMKFECSIKYFYIHLHCKSFFFSWEGETDTSRLPVGTQALFLTLHSCKWSTGPVCTLKLFGYLNTL